MQYPSGTMQYNVMCPVLRYNITQLISTRYNVFLVLRYYIRYITTKMGTTTGTRVLCTQYLLRVAKDSVKYTTLLRRVLELFGLGIIDSLEYTREHTLNPFALRKKEEKKRLKFRQQTCYERMYGPLLAHDQNLTGGLQPCVSIASRARSSLCCRQVGSWKWL